MASTQYGGGGLAPDEARRCWKRELAKRGYRPPLVSFGIWMLGPVLLEFANEANRNRASCRRSSAGRSAGARAIPEPEMAGSDLASLADEVLVRTRAGDHWLINGQKIWTSYANKAGLVLLPACAPTRRRRST